MPEDVAFGGLQVALRVPAFDGLSEQVGRRAVGEALRDGRRRGHRRDLLPPADPIRGEFLLEVSSPGVDRPLTRLKDFETYAGYEARIELDRLVENRRRFKGELAGVDDGQVAIDLEGEDETALIPFDWIAEAKLVITDKLMKRGAEARAARLDQVQEEPNP